MVLSMWPTHSTLLGSSQLTMSIHWTCYCTVHVYVGIHFCDSMRWNRISAGFFIVWLYLYCCSSYQERITGIPLTGLTPPQYCICPNQGPAFPTSYVVVFCVQWCKMSHLLILVDMFKLSFHKIDIILTEILK